MEGTSDIYGDFGNRLKTARELYRRAINADAFTQTDLARLLDVSVKSVSAWEQGTNLPNGEFLIKMSERMRVSVDWLLFGGIQRVPELNVPDWMKKMMLIMRDYPPASEGLLIHFTQVALAEIERNFPDAAKKLYSQQTVKAAQEGGGEVVTATVAERERALATTRLDSLPRRRSDPSRKIVVLPPVHHGQPLQPICGAGKDTIQPAKILTFPRIGDMRHTAWYGPNCPKMCSGWRHYCLECM